MNGTQSFTGLAESQGETFQRLAQETRYSLQFPYYRFEQSQVGHVTVAGVRDQIALGAHRTISPIPTRGFRINRSAFEYRQKHGISPIDFIEALTRGPSPHLILELGPGTGRFLTHLSWLLKPTSKGFDSRFKGRQVDCYGEVDRFYYKVSALVERALGRRLSHDIREAPDLIASHSLQPNSADREVQRIRHQFAGVLGLFLSQDAERMSDIFSDLTHAMPAVTNPESWEGLLEAIDSRNLPDVKREVSGEPYIPSDAMLRLLRRFAQEPGNYLATFPKNYNLGRKPGYLGISSPNIILGGDMRDFIDTVADESLSAVIGTRSSVYLVNDPERDRGIVPFGLKVARKLRPGGGWLDDWPRANYGVRYDLDHVWNLTQKLETDEALRGRCKIFLVWGPSEEFPEQHRYVPVSMMLLKCPTEGKKGSISALRESLIRTLTHEGREIPARFELIEVNPRERVPTGLIDIDRTHDPFIEMRKRLAEKLSQSVAASRSAT